MSFTYNQSPFLSPLLGDGEIAELFSSESDLAAMLNFETALAVAQADAGFIPAAAAQVIAKSISGFKPNLQQLAIGIKRDGMVVPELIRQLRRAIGEVHADHLHFGATSQDLIDTSLSLRAKRAFVLFHARLNMITNSLVKLGTRFGSNGLMGRTRMQRAVPINVQNRIDDWLQGVNQAQAKAALCRFPIQFGGPVGTLAEFGNRGQALKAAVAKQLNMDCAPQNWHSARGIIVVMAEACSHITGILGKLGIDVCLMAQNELAEIALEDSGTSSAMHHKRNPVKAEALVTLARFNATLISGMHQALVHEQERSGAAWALEWMILPQMIVAAGAATRTANELLGSITAMGTAP